MRKIALIVFLSVLFGESCAFAQIVDMRAYSRQRGFKAYHPHQMQTAVVSKRKAYQTTEAAEPVAAEEKASAAADEKGTPAFFSAPAAKDVDGQTTKRDLQQTADMQEYIRRNPHVRPDI